MTDLEKAARQALEALELEMKGYKAKHDRLMPAAHALRQALEKPAEEPVAFPRQAGDSTWIIDTAFIWRVKHTIEPNTPYDWTPSEEQIETVLLALEKIPFRLYTTPQPKREWVGLTFEDQKECLAAGVDNGWRGVMHATEAKLKEKNT